MLELIANDADIVLVMEEQDLHVAMRNAWPSSSQNDSPVVCYVFQLYMKNKKSSWERPVAHICHVILLLSTGAFSVSSLYNSNIQIISRQNSLPPAPHRCNGVLQPQQHQESHAFVFPYQEESPRDDP